ncbi:MAG: VPLPA-CTERM sorting domain-containing protein [Pseudomonadota bacterium]
MRIWLVILTLFSLVAAAAPSDAYFESPSLNLFQVVYKAGGVEVVTDLGAIKNAQGDTALQPGQTLAPSAGVSHLAFSAFGTETAWGDLRVAYFGTDADNFTWFATASADKPDFKGSSEEFGYANFSFSNYYKAQSASQGTNPVTGQSDYFHDPNPELAMIPALHRSLMHTAYNIGMNHAYDSATGDWSALPDAGTFAGLLAGPVGEVDLSDMAAFGYVDMYLWSAEDLAAPYGVLRLTDNGETALMTYIAPTTPIPIPASIVLLGSGIAGVVAARRKRNRNSDERLIER